MNTNPSPKLGLIVNTRPIYHHERFHEAFGDLPWAIYDCPLTRVEPIEAMIPGPDEFDTLIFTSQQGVNMFWGDPRWHGKSVLTVGAATGQAAANTGYRDVISTGENVEDMRRYLSQTPFAKALYPSARDVTAELEKEFPGKIVRVPVYKMIGRVDLPRQFLDQTSRMRMVVPLFSRRTAELFGELLTEAGITKRNSAMVAVGMSPDVIADLEGPWHRTVTAVKPTLKYMVTATDMALSSLSI